MAEQPQWEASIDESLGILRVIAKGDFGPDEWRSLLADVWSKPEWRVPRRLYDARQAGFNFSADETRAFAEEVEGNPLYDVAGMRVAFVVSRDLDFGISRMIQILCDDMPFQADTFRSIEEAERWVLE